MTRDRENWYLAEPGGKPTGPWTTEQVLQKIRSGQLGENLLCWQPGMSEWLPVTAIPLFRKEFASHSQPTDSISRPVRGAVVGAGPSSEAGGGVKAWPDDFSVREDLPSPKSSAVRSRRKSRPALFLWITVPLVLVLIPVAAFIVWHALTNSGPTSGGSSSSNKVDSNSAALAPLVEQYLAELKEINKPEYPQATREKMLAEADRRFAEQLKSWESIDLRGKVVDVHSKQSDVYGAIFRVRVDGPDELQWLSTKHGCKSVIDLYVRLPEEQLSRIQKGDVVRCMASIADVYKHVEVLQPALPIPLWEPDPPKSNLTLQLNEEWTHEPAFPALPPPEWVIVFGSDSTCSIGDFKNIRVIGDPDSPRIREQRKICQSWFEKGDYDKTLQELDRLFQWVPEDQWGRELREKTERILECIAAVKKAEESGDYLAAREHWKKAIEINPADANLKNELDRIDKKLIEEGSKLAESLHSEAERLIRQDKYDDAICIFSRLIERDLSSRVLSPKFSDHLIEMELARATRLTEQGNYTEAAAVIAKLLQPDPYSTDHYPDVRMALTKQFLSRAESLINEEKFSEASTPLEKARQLDTSHSWIDDFLGDLHEVSRMAKLHSEMEVALRGNDLSRAWELVRTLWNITRAFRFKSEEEVNRHFPQAVSVLKRSIERFQKECTGRLTEIGPQLVEKNLAAVEKLNVELRPERAEANRLLQEVFAVEAELPQAEELHEKLARARELQQKIAELEKAQEPDLTGTWRETSSAPSFWPRPEVEIRDDGLLVSVQLKKREETFGFGPRMKVESFSANLNRSRDNPRQLVGTFEAEFEGRSSKFSGRMTITIPENETDRIQVRFSDWPRFDSSGRVIPNPTPQPLHVTWERVKEKEWGPGLLRPGAVRPFP